MTPLIANYLLRSSWDREFEDFQSWINSLDFQFQRNVQSEKWIVTLEICKTPLKNHGGREKGTSLFFFLKKFAMTIWRGGYSLRKQPPHIRGLSEGNSKFNRWRSFHCCSCHWCTKTIQKASAHRRILRRNCTTVQCFRCSQPHVKRNSSFFAWLACCPARNTSTSNTRRKTTRAPKDLTWRNRVRTASTEEFARLAQAVCPTNSSHFLTANTHGKWWINVKKLASGYPKWRDCRLNTADRLYFFRNLSQWNVCILNPRNLDLDWISWNLFFWDLCKVTEGTHSEFAIWTVGDFFSSLRFRSLRINNSYGFVLKKKRKRKKKIHLVD